MKICGKPISVRWVLSYAAPNTVGLALYEAGKVADARRVVAVRILSTGSRYEFVRMPARWIRDIAGVEFDCVSPVSVGECAVTSTVTLVSD
jgi:hypothetical protein